MAWNISVVSPKAWPALKAAALAATTSGRLPNFMSIQSRVGWVGRSKSQLTTPSAKKFLLRSASRGFTPRSLQTSLVRLVMGTR